SVNERTHVPLIAILLHSLSMWQERLDTAFPDIHSPRCCSSSYRELWSQICLAYPSMCFGAGGSAWKTVNELLTLTRVLPLHGVCQAMLWGQVLPRCEWGCQLSSLIRPPAGTTRTEEQGLSGMCRGSNWHVDGKSLGNGGMS